jgi:hypothetical protein
MPAAFHDVSKADDIAFYVSEWILDGVANASLGCKMDYALRPMSRKYSFNCFFVYYVNAKMYVIRMRVVAG